MNTLTQYNENVEPIKTKEEIKEFIESISVSSSAQTRERNILLFIIGINTGLRISDILNLKIEDVKNKTVVTIQEGKTKKKRKVYLNAFLHELTEYIGDKQEGWLFPSRKGDKAISTVQAYRMLNKAAEYINRDDIGTHTMRKTFGYHFYQQTKDIAMLMEIFNHSAPSITKRYIGIKDEEIENSLKDFKLH